MGVDHKVLLILYLLEVQLVVVLTLMPEEQLYLVKVMLEDLL